MKFFSRRTLTSPSVMVPTRCYGVYSHTNANAYLERSVNHMPSGDTPVGCLGPPVVHVRHLNVAVTEHKRAQGLLMCIYSSGGLY